MQIDESFYDKYSFFTFAFTNFDATKSEFLFHDLNDESNSAILKNLKMKECDKKRKHDHAQSCIKNKSIETLLHENSEDSCMQIEINNDAKVINSNFLDFTVNTKIMDHDISFLSTLNQSASTKDTYMENTINVISKSDKNIFNNLYYIQKNNCDVNSVSNLSQEFSSVDIRLENKVMKKIKRMSKNLF